MKIEILIKRNKVTFLNAFIENAFNIDTLLLFHNVYFDVYEHKNRAKTNKIAEGLSSATAYSFLTKKIKKKNES